MIKLLQKTANKTLTKMTENLAQNMVDSCISVASSFIGQSFSISGTTNRRTTEKILKRIDPDTYLRHSREDNNVSSFGGVGDVKMTLKEVAYFISLPEHTYIYVDNTRSSMQLFIFGKEYKKASALFKAALNSRDKGSSSLSDSRNNKIMISTATFNTKGEAESGYFYRISTKTMDEIFTAENNREQITSYISHWKKASDLFQKLNVTHKLGILLYGPPGTGKSSMAKAIALQLDYPIYTMNVSTFPTTVPDLSELFDDSGDDGCIILLEDIDYIFGQNSVERSAEEAAKANALLQMLDGVTSSSNVVFIATTNSVETLNDALVRDGRFDLKICMDNIEHSEATKMCESMNLTQSQTEEILQEETFPINPAALQNKCIKYIFSHLDTWEGITPEQEDVVDLYEWM